MALPRVRSYVASPDPARNRNYLGPAALDALAATVATAHGPSGPNCDYVYRLADAMRALGVADAELFELEDRVRRLRGESLIVAADGISADAATAPAE